MLNTTSSNRLPLFQASVQHPGDGGAYEASYALAVAVECGMRARTAKKNAMKR